MLLQRDSTTDELTGRLTEQILTGQLPPGRRLRESEFADQFDVSRNTLREALHRLAREGLVVHRPHRGITVACPTPDDVDEIFRIRKALETAGLRVAGPGVADDLADLAMRMDMAAEAQDWPLLVDLDLRFHARLVAALACPRLDEFFAAVLRELRLSFVLIDSKGGTIGPPSHVPDHSQVAQALAESRIVDATVLLEAHLTAAKELVMEELDEGSSRSDVRSA